jgi:two-component system response regulator BaeR
MNAISPHWVLVVEDDPKISQLLLDYLHAEGISGKAVADGLQAVKVAEQDRPAVILLDLMLPGLDGMGVCRAVRTFSDAPSSWSPPAWMNWTGF